MPRIETLDLGFQGTPETIASFLVVGPAGPVLLETGPGSTLPRLVEQLEERGFAPQDVQGVLVTHIHLDHAGGAGWWAQQGVPVYVHSAGAPHLIDPSKLLASAERIYGDRMGPLWGQTLPAPRENIIPVEDGDAIEVAGLRFRALSTPGHARHHHVYRLDDIGFMGDALGILLPKRNWIDLPAPPPEFDLEAWKESLQRIRQQEFSTIYRTHFGEVGDVAEQIDSFEQILIEAANLVRQMMAEGLERSSMVDRYQSEMRDRATAAGLDQATAKAYELANPRDMSVDGIARYWRKKDRQD
jgi:glyoxylase-like metal-dependent hydrolase (beta-lactamase superfamily II)